MGRGGSRQQRAARKRKRRMDQADNDLTDAQWGALKDSWGGCAYCKSADASVQRDCVQPLSRGGTYTLDNVVPACRSCNASKSNNEVTSWMRKRRFDERTFLERLHAVQSELIQQFTVESDIDEDQAE